MSTPIVNFTVRPSYGHGFVYAWEVSQSLADPGPWRFTVEEGEAPAGPWVQVSPELIGTYGWLQPSPRRPGKDAVLYYRVVMVTPVARYESEVIMPYGDLGRRDFLIAREIMRKEKLTAAKFEGVEGQLWLVSTFGPKCTACLDPITGMVRDGHCPACLGTGRAPAYHGPYEMWFKFSVVQRKTQPSDAGTVQPLLYRVRCVGAPPAKTNDLVIDTGNGKRYYVDSTVVVSEIRRVPVIQELTVHEAPLSDIAYKIGP